jgi:hypothetical protein
MKILFCNKYNFPFSGTEVYLFELMDLLRSRGHEVALFSMADPRGEPTPNDHHFVPHIDFKDASGDWKTRARQAAHAIYSTESRADCEVSSHRSTPTSRTYATSITNCRLPFCGS